MKLSFLLMYYKNREWGMGSREWGKREESLTKARRHRGRGLGFLMIMAGGS